MNYSQSKTKRSSNREITMKPTSKPKPVARKKSTPVPMPVKPKAKPKTLNDFLKQNKRPPSKNKKGTLSSPDVIIKGYNDKKSRGMK
jgi:tripartite-type tricarboxylate transporter receptor subunit TctC